MNDILYTIQGRHQLPTGLDWLTAGERARFDEFRFEKRRRDWLLGRWAGKQALSGILDVPDRYIGRIEIGSAPDGAPLPTLDGQPCQVQLSLSHSNDRALAAVSDGTAALGCDIELVETRGANFVETFFTAAECARIARADHRSRDTLVTMIWSAKESVLKALRTGLRADTYSVEVIDAGDLLDTGWNTARVLAANSGEFYCQWCIDGPFIVAIVTREAVAKPIDLSKQAVTGNSSVGVHNDCHHRRRRSALSY